MSAKSAANTAGGVLQCSAIIGGGTRGRMGLGPPLLNIEFCLNKFK